MTKINIDYQEIKKSYIGVSKAPKRHQNTSKEYLWCLFVRQSTDWSSGGEKHLLIFLFLLN